MRARGRTRGVKRTGIQREQWFYLRNYSRIA
jgi:hypothetical protein